MAGRAASLSIEPLAQQQQQQQQHAAPPTCAAYDAATSTLAVGGADGTVAVVAVGRGSARHARRVLGCHGGRVTGLCLLPWRRSGGAAGSAGEAGGALFATSSVDATLRLWASHPKALCVTDACLQTLRGHTAAVTCVAAVQIAHTWCLLSGSADGTLLLWRAAADDDGADGDQRAAAQLVPHLELAAPLWTAPGRAWVLDLTCQLQPMDAGAAAGVFVAVAGQPVMHLALDRAAVASSGAGAAGATASRQASQCLLASCCSSSRPRSARSSARLPAASRQPGAGLSDGAQQRGAESGLGAPAALLSAQHRVFACAFIPAQLSTLALAYDGCCRRVSAVDGSVATCWRSPTGSCFTAMAAVGPGTQHRLAPQLAPQVLLLGDDRGWLHVYSLDSECLLATKQLARSRITAIVCCGCGPGSSSSSSGSSSSSSGSGSSNSGDRGGSGSGSSSSTFAVLCQEGLGLWQLRQGLGHSLLPGGHRQAVIAVQVCDIALQLDSVHGLPSLTRQRAASPADGSGAAASGSEAAAARMLLTAGVDGRVIQWDLAGPVPSVFGILATAGAAQGSELSAMAFLAGCGVLATGHDSGAVLLWRLDTGSHQALGPSGHSNTVSCLAPAVTAKGDELLLSASFDGAVCLWEPRQLRGMKPHLLARFQAHGGPPDCCMQPARSRTAPSNGAGTTFGAGSTSGGGMLQQPAVGPKLPSLARPASPGFGFRGSSAGGAAGSLVAAAAGSKAPEVLALLFEPAGDAFSHDLIFTGGTDCTIKVWSGSASGQLLGQHVGHSGQVTCLALDGSVLFSGSQDTTIGVFDALPQSFAPAAGAGGSLPPPGGLGSSVASSSPAGRTPGCVPAPPASAAFRVLRGHAAAVTGLQVVARTGVVVSCGRDGRLLQWNYVTGQLLASQTLAPAHELTCVAVHQRGGGVLVGSAGGQVLSAATLQAGADGGVAAAQAAAALQQGSAEALLQLLHKPRASGG